MADTPAVVPQGRDDPGHVVAGRVRTGDQAVVPVQDTELGGRVGAVGDEERVAAPVGAAVAVLGHVGRPCRVEPLRGRPAATKAAPVARALQDGLVDDDDPYTRARAGRPAARATSLPLALRPAFLP